MERGRQLVVGGKLTCIPIHGYSNLLIRSVTTQQLVLFIMQLEALR